MLMYVPLVCQRVGLSLARAAAGRRPANASRAAKWTMVRVRCRRRAGRRSPRVHSRCPKDILYGSNPRGSAGHTPELLRVGSLVIRVGSSVGRAPSRCDQVREKHLQKGWHMERIKGKTDKDLRDKARVLWFASPEACGKEKKAIHPVHYYPHRNEGQVASFSPSFFFFLFSYVRS